MRYLRALFAFVTTILAFAAAPARATDTRDYAKDEYAIIRGGLAPDKEVSLAAHGDGEGGSDNFHIWLMAEPAHRRIAALDGIGSSNNLDTGPDAYHASWSADSRRVAVAFRSDRHVLELNLYRIENRRAHLISGPSLFREVTSRDIGPDDDLRRSVPGITWSGGNRVKLTEHRLFMTTDPGFARRLGGYGRVMDKLEEGRLTVEFSAEAECMLMPGNRYRIVDLRVGKFSGSGSW